MNRRHFLGAGMAGAISLHHFPHHLFAATQPKNANRPHPPRATQDRGEPRGMGTGHNGGNGSSKPDPQAGLPRGRRALPRRLDQALTSGFRRPVRQPYLHPRSAQDRTADKVVILTKTNSTTAAAVKADIDRYRRELGVDQIDILLLHRSTGADWNVRMRPCMDIISEARDRGIVRSHGTSCHTLQALKTAAAELGWKSISRASIPPDCTWIPTPNRRRRPSAR